MKKVVLKVEVFDEKTKRKAMKAVSDLEGLESIEMNMKDKKLTLIGDIDPVIVVSKLTKYCRTQILTVGPAKEEKKKEEPKKDEPKKDANKGVVAQIAYPLPYYNYNYNQYHQPPMNTHYYRPVVEHDPGCVIC